MGVHLQPGHRGARVLAGHRFLPPVAAAAISDRTAPPGRYLRLLGRSAKAQRELGWQATRDIDAMCADSWRWQSANPKTVTKGNKRLYFSIHYSGRRCSNPSIIPSPLQPADLASDGAGLPTGQIAPAGTGGEGESGLSKPTIPTASSAWATPGSLATSTRLQEHFCLYQRLRCP